MEIINSIKIIGRLARDPEVRYTKTGKAVVSFDVAVSRGKAKEGEKEATDFIPIVVWGSLAEMCGNSLTKGQSVFVEGRLQVRSYETQDGQKRRVTEIVANFVAQNIMSDHQKPNTQQTNKANFGDFGKDVTDEDIPF